MAIVPVPKLTAKAGAGSSSPGVMFFNRLIQQMKVTDSAQEVSICWKDAHKARSHTMMRPELSKHSCYSGKNDRQNDTYLHLAGRSCPH
jgi:hypothetical protein